MGELRGGSTIGGYPIETTKGSQSKVDAHAGDTTKHITAAERTAWNAKAGTAVATTSANGLMAAADKTKLDGIAAGANNYSLPTATASVLGGVKTGTNITNSSGTISVPNASTSAKGVVQLYNALTSTSVELALTAAQGKVLNDRVTNIESEVITIAAGSDVKRYIKIAEMASSTSISSGLSNLTLMLTGVGNFGSPKPGSVLAHLSNRGGIGGQVYVINDNSINVNPIQYVNNTTTGKIDVYYVDTGTYEYHTTIRILSNIGGNTVKIFSTVTTAPAGLTPYPSFNKFETQAGAQTRVDTHANNSTAHITATERTTWNAKAGTAVATTSANGLMAAADKIKLDGIATGANNYSLPTATASVLGGVKTGTNITNTSGTISVPNASTSTKGAVQLHNALTSTATDLALTAAQGKVLNDKTGDLTALKTQAKGSLVLALNEVFQSASDSKALLSTTITGKGVPTAATDTYAKMSENIKAIKTGVELQGLVKSYKAAAGETLTAGGLVDFITGDASSAGEPKIFDSSYMMYQTATLLSEDRVLVAYSDTNYGSYGKAVILTIVGEDITVGDPTIFRTTSVNAISVTALSPTRAMVCFSETTYDNYGRVTALTITDSNIIVGGTTTFATNATKAIEVKALTQDKALVAYCDADYKEAGYATVLTYYSGSYDYASSGSPVPIGSDHVTSISIAPLSDSRAVISYREGEDQNCIGKAVSVRIDRAFITVNTPVVIANTGLVEVTSTALSDVKVLVCYKDNVDYTCYAVILLAPITDHIYVGTRKQASTVNSSYPNVAMITEDTAVLSYGGGSSVNPMVTVIKISSNDAIIVGSRTTVRSVTGMYTLILPLSGNRALSCFSDAFNSFLGNASIVSVDNMVANHKPLRLSVRDDIFSNTITRITKCLTLSSDRVLICFTNTSDHLLGVVVTVGAKNITMGSVFTLYGYAIENLKLVHLSQTKVLAVFSDINSGNYGKAVVLTMHGNSISSGTFITFASAYTYDISVTSLTRNKFLVTYMIYGNPQYATSVILTVTGANSITVGTATVLTSEAVSEIRVIGLSNTKALLVYCDVGNRYAKCLVLTIKSDDTITLGTVKAIKSNLTAFIETVILSETRVLLCYANKRETGVAVVLTVSGTTVTTGSEVTFTNSYFTYIAMSRLSHDRVIVSIMGNDEGYRGISWLLAVSGSAINVSKPSYFSAWSHASNISMTTLSSKRALVSYTDSERRGFGYIKTIDVGSPDGVVKSISGTTASVVVPW